MTITAIISDILAAYIPQNFSKVLKLHKTNKASYWTFTSGNFEGKISRHTWIAIVDRNPQNNVSIRNTINMMTTTSYI